MTDEIARLVELSERATRGPWVVYDQPGYYSVVAENRGMFGQSLSITRTNGSERNKDDIDFIAALVNWFRATHCNAAHQEELKEEK